MANYFKSLNESFDRMYADAPCISGYAKLDDEPVLEGETVACSETLNEDGAEQFLNGLVDSLLSHISDVTLQDVAEASQELSSLPDYLPMTGEEAHKEFVDAVRELARAAFVKYCVEHRDSFDECLKEEKKPPEGNAIDRYQRWVDFDMSHYGKISKRTQDFVNKAGYQILKDDHGDYEVAAGHFE